MSSSRLTRRMNSRGKEQGQPQQRCIYNGETGNGDKCNNWTMHRRAQIATFVAARGSVRASFFTFEEVVTN